MKKRLILFLLSSLITGCRALPPSDSQTISENAQISNQTNANVITQTQNQVIEQQVQTSPPLTVSLGG